MNWKNSTSSSLFYRFNGLRQVTFQCVLVSVAPMMLKAQTTYTATWSSITLSDNRENAYSAYTLTATNPASGGGPTANSYIAIGQSIRISIPAGDITTFTGGTYNGVAIAGWSFNSSLEIVFNSPVAIAKGAVFTIVLNNISNPSFMGAPCANPNPYPGNCGFMCCVTNDIKMLATNATGADNIFSGGLYTIAQTALFYKMSASVTASTLDALLGTAENEIIYLVVEIGGSTGASLSATSFTMNTTGTTNTADITSAQLWYTGTTPVFHAPGDQQVSTTVANPSGVITLTSTINLSKGKNYFWLIYDIPCTATVGNFVDAQFTSVTVGGTAYTPAVTAPAGNRKITTNIVNNSVNYVPNPGFETYSTCPTGYTSVFTNIIAYATPWNYISPTTGGTSDFFHACGGGVPSNNFGYQPARTGNGYIGFGYPSKSAGSSYEYIQAPLSTSLVAGTTYAFTMYATMANKNFASPSFIDGWGAYFSASQVTTGNVYMLPVTPQIISNSIIQDSINWERISGTFVAAGGESWIVVGNFKNSASLQANGTGAGYYYIDDISLGTLSTVIPCVSLPVELLSFSANCTENNTVRVEWSTATQTNNDYFTIERSMDGNNFEVIGTVDGAGNSSTLRNYEFVDPQLETFNLKSETLFYRMKQTDFNGQSEIFPPVSVSCTGNSVFSVFIYPNMDMTITGAVGDVLLSVRDMTGKELFSKNVMTENGSVSCKIDMQGKLSAGIYFITAINKNNRVNKKIAKF